MNRRIAISAVAVAAIAAVTIVVLIDWRAVPAANDMPMHGDAQQDAHGDAAGESGPHGGRLLEDGEFAVEVLVFESGIPPEFRLYAYETGEPVAPADVDASIEIERLGGERVPFAFEPELDYLRGIGVVHEPHSFDVAVTATFRGRRSEWRYESHEGRTRIPGRVAEAQGIAVEAAGPATIRDVVELTGTVQIDPGRIADVRARFPGVVTSVDKTVGDAVDRGETLATIETNESLRTVSLEAPLAGLVIDRHIQAGQPAGDETLFVIADLSEVWVNLDVFGSDLDAIAVGQPAEIETLGGTVIQETIDWVSPLVAHGSQSIRARATVRNDDFRLRPGQFVRARIVTAEHEVPLAVEQSALQTFRDLDVVFARVGDVYEVRMLELGRRDAEHVEVLGGLEPGETYVIDNSYLIKADIEKSGASHDH